ncbi:phytoene desaturase family protein [Robiginitalea sp. M366]|uniref:phytoene desaturase family protein n=1 Tax=Robiginitalea aestuariiviva TaxID=3036903 RepID=UPI00240DE1E2|nr:phytoene desaturase family protein [Robiginitalea aestuariiviva]MDG1572436.1 phytoene desaturase family protein [Robiginitalea aestuariiviva]
MDNSVAIIGSGFSALSAACYLARDGKKVQVYEKNEQPGGRASQLKREGFTFDMGPSWYWMPDIFEKFFADFGKSVSDYYTLDRLSPGYQIFFSDDVVTIGDSLDKIYAEFERLEPGSSEPLKRFMVRAADHYDIAINKMVYKPGVSPLELVSRDTIQRVGRFFSTISRDIRKDFKNPKLVSILEFPVLFLGAKPSDTPSFYSFMNHADFTLGTWHPRGGMYRIVEGMVALARSLGVTFHTQSPVEGIAVENGKAIGLFVGGDFVAADTVLSGADYHHTETLLPQHLRQYSENYWDKRTFAPSSLLFYVGFDRKLAGVQHHNLFFDTDFEQHAREIYDRPQWPEAPLFYANFPSVTDPTMAPEGKEAGFFLIPLAPGLEDNAQLREMYFNRIVDRLEQRTGSQVRNNIIFKESFCVSDFVNRYNSYKGNAYGMANTLRQTAFLRPGLQSKKVQGLYFTGQLTVPGPGVPPSLISGKLVSELIRKQTPQLSTV